MGMGRLSRTNHYMAIPKGVTGVRKGLGVLAFAAVLAGAPPSAVLAEGVILQPAPAAQPQSGPRPDPNDPDSVIVEELVVVARDRGPAWWSVSNGASTVYVLGAPTLAPKRLPWDTTTLERRLQGASLVILPYRLKMHVARSIPTAWNFMRLRSASPFEEGADPAVRARFAAAREKISQPASRYKTKNPLAAGLSLASDYRAHWGLTSNDTAKVAKVYAERAKAPIFQPEYDTAPILGAVLHAPSEAGHACLDAVLEQVEAGPAATLASAKAWAEGDTPEALANDRTYERCFYLAPGARAFEARTKGDTVAAIEQALQKPGHAVAVVWLPPLLSRGGVLDQLRAKGYQVKTPGQT
jgi:uncharacterized protein YbaP (TraB family)